MALTHLRPARDGSGRVQVRRVYGFEVSANGTSRLGGSITLTGQRVDSIFLPDPASQTGAT